jgi:hypothetical protein
MSGSPISGVSNKSLLEHRMGFEPMNTGFADQRVSHFAIGAHARRAPRIGRTRRGFFAVNPA